jgi:hypothetical protein
MIASFPRYPGSSWLLSIDRITMSLNYSKNNSFVAYGDSAILMHRYILSWSPMSKSCNADCFTKTSNRQHAALDAEMQHKKVWCRIWRLTGHWIIASPRVIGTKIKVSFESSQSERPVSSRWQISSAGITETQILMRPMYWFRYWRGTWSLVSSPGIVMFFYEGGSTFQKATNPPMVRLAWKFAWT